MAASDELSVVCHVASLCFSVQSGQRCCGPESGLVGRVEPIDCTGVCCTKLQKIREAGLVFPNLSIQRGRTFFRYVGILGGACHSTGCLVFLTLLVT